MSSYGMYVVRGGGHVAEQTLVRALLDCTGHEVPRIESFGTADPGLHVDMGDENEITIHHTHQGRAEMIVLRGSKYQKQGEPTDILTPRVFQYDRLNAAAVTLPSLALRTVLETGDVAILDHSQLHAARSLTPDRESRSIYLSQYNYK
jgi:hypothetical protein